MLEVPDHQLAPIHGFPGDGVRQHAAERALANNPQHERSLGIGKRLGGPLHELRKIVERRGLDLVLAGQ